MNKTIFITTSIPYVNSDPHLGHTLEAVQTDALARFYQSQGDDVYALTGTDDNAIKNVEAAEKAGLPIQEFVDQKAARFNDLAKVYDLHFNQFIRTSGDKHKKGAEKFWKLCEKDIYKKTYTGLYCVGCETFYKDGEHPGNICPLHNRPLEEVSEENYFFALSRYTDMLSDLIKSDKLHVAPASKKTELLNMIENGLDDFSVSRPATRAKGWGVPVPGDESQMMYVWFDALTNYITALDFAGDQKLYDKYWVNADKRIHIIGKDIIKFHALYWPAMLASAEQPLPTDLFVHGFMTVDGVKMSKSIGNVIDPFALVDAYGVDPVRYYLLREIPALDDGDFSYNRMGEIYNADLANELGNLLSRLTTIASKDELELSTTKGERNEKVEALFESYQFHSALESIWEEVKVLNREVNEFEPWAKSASERAEFLKNALTKIHGIGLMLIPVMPQTAQKIVNATDGKIAKSPPLFPRM